MVQVVTGDSQEEVIIFRDTQTDRHFIIIYISSSLLSPSQVDTDTMVLIIEQFLLLILIMGRFMMPRVRISIFILKYNFNITTLTG